jgi:CRP-like cAMP-binding protein
MSRSDSWLVDKIMTDSRIITLFHGEALFRAGQQATHFYLVQQGTINIVNQAGVTTMREFVSGELFGIPEVLARGNWMLSAVAWGPTRVQSFTAERLFSSLAEMPDSHSDFLCQIASLA